MTRAMVKKKLYLPPKIIGDSNQLVRNKSNKENCLSLSNVTSITNISQKHKNYGSVYLKKPNHRRVQSGILDRSKSGAIGRNYSNI